MHQLNVTDQELSPFRRSGTRVRITNSTSQFVEPADHYFQEGEIDRVWLEGKGKDAHLKATFLWIARKTASGWEELTEPVALRLCFSVLLFATVEKPDSRRLLFEPRVPISHDQVSLVMSDYVGKDGSKPLRREDIIRAA